MKNRTILYRALAAAFLAVLAAVMLVIGRGHMVYLDNKTLDYDSETHKAPYRIDVYANGDGERTARLGARDRGEAVCIGQTFRMRLEVTEEKGGEPEVRDLTVKLPYGLDGVVLNLPGLLDGLPEEAWLTEFVPLAAAEEEPEEPDTGEGIPDVDILPGADEMVPGDI